MLDAKYIRENKDLIIKNTKSRNPEVKLDDFFKTDEKRLSLLKELEGFRAKKNTFKKKPSEKDFKELKTIKEKEEKLESELQKLNAKYFETLNKIPNLTHPEVVVSENEDDNPVLENVGEIPKFDFTPKDHVELMENLDLVDFERAAKVAGAKFYYLKNEAAMLEFALIQYALDVVRKHGFTVFSTPDLAKRSILEGLGFNPRGESSQVYNVENDDLCLIGTAEITMGGYHADEILDAKDLPKKYVAVSHCFRTEAGSYSKFSKGIFRVHQFTKIEMFQYVLPEKAEEAHGEILNIEKEIYSGLGIPFRVIDHCTADLGTPAYRTFDLEAWLPGKPNRSGGNGDWAEITSTSNCTDFQARGLNIKYKDNKGTKEFIYMLNGTAIAVGRTIISIIENFQRADGSIMIPEALRPYMGGLEEIRR